MVLSSPLLRDLSGSNPVTIPPPPPDNISAMTTTVAPEPVPRAPVHEQPSLELTSLR